MSHPLCLAPLLLLCPSQCLRLPQIQNRSIRIKNHRIIDAISILSAFSVDMEPVAFLYIEGNKKSNKIFMKAIIQVKSYIRQAASTLTPPSAPNHDNINIIAHNIGGMTKTYHYCDAKLWPTETSSLCCANGQVNLPPLQTLPEPFHQLFVGDTAESKCFEITFEVTIPLSHLHHLV